jgi:hypothetical protein
MTILHRLWCWLRSGHTDLRIFSVDKKEKKTTYICRDCLTVWNEYD